MAEGDDAQGSGSGAPVDRPQDPYVDRMRPDPSQPPQSVLTLAGLLGDSDRPGFRRLYFTRDLDYYAEFRTEDLVETASILPAEPPFVGHDATRVTLKRAATIEYTRVRSPRPIDEFDLDIRLGRTGEPLRPTIGFTEDICDLETQLDRCGGNTDFTCPGDCVPDTQRTYCGRPGSTCLEVCDATPFFCNTQGRATCGTCQGNTCQTCNTCAATCRTCETCQGQATCRTCETCGPAMCP